jgi:hypothetical protein
LSPLGIPFEPDRRALRKIVKKRNPSTYGGKVAISNPGEENYPSTYGGKVAISYPGEENYQDKP